MFLIVFAVLAASGVLLVVLGWMTLNGKLPRNQLAGIRTPFTLESDENWYATHRAAAPLTIFGGVAVAMVALAFLPFVAAGKVSPGISAAVTLFTTMVLLVVALASWRVGTRAARGRHA